MDNGQSDFEEGEISSDEDYSPGSLVIDMDNSDPAIDQTPIDESPMAGPPDYQQPSEPNVTLDGAPNNTSTAPPGNSIVSLAQILPVGRDGQAPVDTIILYHYLWGQTQLEVLVSKHHPTYIPVKNIYQRVIPHLKINILSARISKNNIRSQVFSEPYVSTIKKLNIGLTGSAHYVSVMDFVKICRHSKYEPPKDLYHFRHVTAELTPSDVLEMFNNPGGVRGRELLEGCGCESVDVMSVASPAGPAPQETPGGGLDNEGMAEVDARKLSLPQGNILLILRGDQVFIPNPELAKLLPNTARTAMEVMRNNYNIIVEQSTKPEINVMKVLGVVSPKAGRTLMYRVSDVAKMYPHWKMIIPQFIEDLCAGKVPEKRIDTASLQTSSIISSPLPKRRRRNGRPKSKLSESQPADSAWAGKLEQDSDNMWNSANENQVSKPNALTPDWFQEPVKLLNSIEQALNKPAYPVIEGSGHVTKPGSLPGNPGHVTTAGGHMSKPRAAKPKRRRSSTNSGPPLDDTGLDYVPFSWGEATLTLLCPNESQPYIALPEFIKKVLEDRTATSVQRRAQLGVVSLPATSLQMHTLRAHGSLGEFSGNVKLISLGDAVRLTASAHHQIPGSVVQALRSYQQFLGCPVEQLLIPEPLPSPPETPEPQQTTAVATPRHPGVIDLGPNYNLGDGLMCQIQWAGSKIVVYIKSPGEFYMGLYQVYEELFKKQVVRMNFKMRMRKLRMRSIRALPVVRLKLIELGALPPHCPVCGLLLVSQVEKLAKSYGVVAPDVVYEAFIANEKKVQMPMAQPRKPNRIKKPPPIKQEATPPQNIYMYEFNNGSDSTQHKISLVNKAKEADPTIGRTDNDKLVSPVYGVVPYLTSSRGYFDDTPPMENLTTVSSPPVPTNQLIPPSDDSMIVSIPRSLTKFHYTPQKPTSGPQNFSSHGNSLGHPNKFSGVTQEKSMGGPRGKVLQTLAKKIAQKSRKYTPKPLQLKGLVGSEGSKINVVCPACGRMNPSGRDSCEACGGSLGKKCSSCGLLSMPSATSCSGCHANLELTWKSSMKSGTVTPSDSIVSPSSSSPTSPKFSAPPIRSAVLKNLFPQAQSAAAGPRPEPAGSNGQLISKTTFLGNISSSRKCPECGQLNTKMAKKCVQCRSHLQGRACLRCGRPNLSIVSECYKCGAPLPTSTVTRWVYKGSRTGREYKTVPTTEEKILASSAPVSCIRCHGIRLHSRFKCGRCGDVFRTRPLVARHPDEDLGEPNNQKKRRISHDTVNQPDSSSTAIEGLGRNILTLGLADQLTPLLLQREQEARDQLPGAEDELQASQLEYDTFTEKKHSLEVAILEGQSELDGLISEIERLTAKLDRISFAEAEARKVADSAPSQIKELVDKIEIIEQTRVLVREL